MNERYDPEEHGLGAIVETPTGQRGKVITVNTCGGDGESLEASVEITTTFHGNPLTVYERTERFKFDVNTLKLIELP